MDHGVDRKGTLLALIALAEDGRPNDCFDDEHAVALLRSQSTPEELRSLGVSDQVIAFVFAEDRER